MQRRMIAAAATVVALGVAACGNLGNSSSGSGASSTGTVTIGASIPLSGTLAFFGQYVKWGYQHAVAQVNAAGGVTVGGKKEKVKLVLLDDQSDPATTVSNIQTLITSDHAAALLGSCTPPLVNPGALAANRAGVPLVTGCAPVIAFTSVTKWKYAWDLFFYEPDLTRLPFETLQSYGSKTNHKIAILHDNGPDGLIAGGKLWPQYAKQYGYKITLDETFSTSATDFSADVAAAKASGADIVLADCDTPQAIAIRKQMATDAYAPKVLDIEKGAEPFQYSTALGSLAAGTLVGGYWSPSVPYPGAAALASLYEKQTGNTYSQHIADSYTAAMVLLQAISRANSVSANAINTAIGATNAMYPVGQVKFGSDHAAILNVVELQWQNGKTVQVWPVKTAQSKFQLGTTN